MTWLLGKLPQPLLVVGCEAFIYGGLSKAPALLRTVTQNNPHRVQ
jgi:hypothetical protein